MLSNVRSHHFELPFVKNSLFSQKISVTTYLVVVHSSLLHTFEISYSIPLETKDLIQRPLKAMGIFPLTSNGIWVKPICIIVCNNDLTAIAVFRVCHKTLQNSHRNCRGIILQNTCLSIDHVLLVFPFLF